MLIREAILIVIGIAGGFVVGGGVFAFITMIGVIPRLADRTKTAVKIYQYETAIIWGGTLGNIVSLFSFRIPLGVPFLAATGLFFGIYVGCLAVALAEVLKVIPIFIERLKLQKGLKWIILSVALGKGTAAVYQLILK